MLVRAIFADPRMNKTELAYASEVLEPKHIAGEIRWWGFEPMKLRLADNTHYTVDFLLVFADGHLEAHEVKALWSTGKAGFTDDARVKIKVAASMYPMIQFRVVNPRDRRGGGGWDVEAIGVRPMPRMGVA